MNYNKEYINNLVKKLLKDIKRDYIDTIPFDTKFINNENIYGSTKTIKNAWEVIVYVQEDQFPDKEEYAIIINYSGDVESYLDISCGRPIPMKAVLEEEKYQLMVID